MMTAHFGDARLPTRFWAKVGVAANGCWQWNAALTGGYGSYGVRTRNRRTALAHRVSYMTLVGAIPGGLELDHLCRNRACVNPAHLEPVTRSENCLRSPLIGKWKSATTHCPKGHAYDASNTYHDTRRGKRQCRACCNEAQRAYRERQRQAA